MNFSFTEWLQSKNIENPHVIPSHLKLEFKSLFDNTTWFWPQPGGQEKFLNCPADICLYGGEAGAGKSFSLIMDSIKWIGIEKFAAAIVRKTYSQIFDAGGLWSEAKKIFMPIGGRPTKGDKPKFIFPSGSEIYFKHSQHAQDVEKYWQGLQAAVIYIDELTHFTKDEFLYIMTRNRDGGLCGIKPYMRMTCNPDPSSWVKDMIQWWIGDDGYIIKERSGVIRYFVHKDDKFIFADSKEELKEQYPTSNPLSFTFIRGYLDDNIKLLESDPEYRAKLENASASQQKALIQGNWNFIDNPDALFQQSNINANRLDKINIEDLNRIVIGVDPAGSTNETSDETGIVVVGVDSLNNGYVLADETGKYKPNDWAAKVASLYDAYGADCVVAEKNYGGDMVFSTINNYRSDICPKMVTASRGKELRAEPIAMLYTQNRVHHVGHNLNKLEAEQCCFDPMKVKKKEQKSPNRLDALVWGLTEVIAKKRKAEPRVMFL